MYRFSNIRYYPLSKIYFHYLIFIKSIWKWFLWLDGIFVWYIQQQLVYKPEDFNLNLRICKHNEGTLLGMMILLGWSSRLFGNCSQATVEYSVKLDMCTKYPSSVMPECTLITTLPIYNYGPLYICSNESLGHNHQYNRISLVQSLRVSTCLGLC